MSAPSSGLSRNSVAQVCRSLAFRGRRLWNAILVKMVGLMGAGIIGSLSAKGVELSARAMQSPKALRFLFKVDNRLLELEGQLAVAYDGGVHTKHRHMRYHDFFVARIKPGEWVLDVGCGKGEVAYDVAEKSGATVVAIDTSSGYIEFARTRHPHERVQYILGDVLSYRPEGTFDVVILSNILEHLPERVAFLRAIKDVTGTSRFLIRVPLFERDWRVPLMKELGVDWRLDPTHQTEYTLESFAAEMAEADLAISYQEVRWGEIWAEVAVNEKHLKA